MNKKQIMKITVDLLMTVILLLLMTYEYIGQEHHEWIGCGMFLLFILHQLLNGRWLMSVCKGKYPPYRIVQTLLVILIFCNMFGSMISGIFLSQTVFAAFELYAEWANAVHMLCAYWGFVWISLHLGLHWGMITGMMRKMSLQSKKTVNITLRIVGLCIVVYGIYAFIKRDFLMYMTLKYHFALFNYDEPLACYLLDHVAIMGLFVGVGHYLGKTLRHRRREAEKKFETQEQCKEI